MNVRKMSEAGAVDTLLEICDGLKRFATVNPESALPLLEALAPVLDDLAADDFFGTEGWEIGLGVS